MTFDLNREIERIITHLGDLSFEGKSILITGGSGFLGSWISNVLIQQNARVVCLDNHSSGRMENINPLLDCENFSFVHHDVSEPFGIEEKIDFVFHLASRASPFEFSEYPIDIIKANTYGTINALEIARRHGATFLFTSTSEVYGDARLLPTPETYNGNVNPIGIRGCYEEAKRLGESMCMAYVRQYNVNVRIARIFNTFGPRMRADGIYGRVIPRFIIQAHKNMPITVFGDGSQTRSFCYVTDQIEGLLRLALMDDAKGEIINIGNDQEIPILQLAKRIIQLMDSDSEVVFEGLPDGDPQRRRPDISKAWNLLRFKPRISLDEGLASTISYLTARGHDDIPCIAGF